MNKVILPIIVMLWSVAFIQAQRGTGSNPAATTTTLSSFSLAPAPTPVNQVYFTWDYDTGASNSVSWGLARNAWTNGSRTITTNVFPYTNGWHYKVTAIVNGIESTPALWPSNRFDRVIVQTSTNLLTWADAFTWTTNFNKPQEYLRLRSELIRWE